MATSDLTDRLGDVATELAGVRAELADERLWRRRLAAVWLVFLLVLGAVVGYVAWSTTQTRAAAHQSRCTQTLILSILNDPKVQAQLQAHHPIANPCG